MDSWFEFSINGGFIVTTKLMFLEGIKSVNYSFVKFIGPGFFVWTLEPT